MRKLSLGRKIFSAVLTSALVLGLAGCGSSGGSESAPADTGSAPAAESTAAADSSAGEEEAAAESTAEPTTLTVMVYERGNTTETYGSATDNYWTRWIQSEFGDPNNITIEYIPVPRSEETQKINTLMASGTDIDRKSVV